VVASLVDKGLGKQEGMLRKLLWTGLYAGLGAVATLMSRRAASKIWRVATGEPPPTKK
jgi:hypothetical protein